MAGDKGNTGGHATAHRGTPAPAPTPQARVTGDSPHAIKAVHSVASLAASFNHDVKAELLQPNKTAPSGLMTQLVDEQLQQQQAAAHEVMQHSLLQAGSTEWLRKRPGAAFFEKLQVGNGAKAADSLSPGSTLLHAVTLGCREFNLLRSCLGLLTDLACKWSLSCGQCHLCRQSSCTITAAGHP